MHEQAREVLFRFQSAVGVEAAADPPRLFGHSDCASIALVYAATYPAAPSRLVALEHRGPAAFDPGSGTCRARAQ